MEIKILGKVLYRSKNHIPSVSEQMKKFGEDMCEQIRIVGDSICEDIRKDGERERMEMLTPYK